jgi:hypothetical protein
METLRELTVNAVIECYFVLNVFASEYCDVGKGKKRPEQKLDIFLVNNIVTCSSDYRRVLHWMILGPKHAAKSSTTK